MYTGISGTFSVAGDFSGGSPLLFKANDPGIWKNLATPPAAAGPQGSVRLRLEGIDLLETDCAGAHQPLKFAREALDFLLSRLGIRSNLFGPSHAREGVAGFIAAAQTVGPGWPVAFAFRRGPGLAEGKEILLDAALVRESINYQLLAAGLAYPAYDRDLPPELRQELTRACRDARNAGLGFWPQDRTGLGVAVRGLQDLAKRYVIFPQLFRRLVRHLHENGDLRGFKAYLQAHPDPLVHLPTGRSLTLGALVEVEEDFLRLNAAPEDLVFTGI